MSESRGPIGLASATALVAASMIGAGVFTASGYSLGALGSPKWVLLAWVVGGLIALCGALSYGGLARRFRDSGGEYLYLSEAVHPAAGVIAGWVSMTAGFTGAIALAAVTMELYLAPAMPEWVPQKSVAVASILATAALHAFRVRPGAFTQNALVAIKFALLVGIVVVAAGRQAQWGSTLAGDGSGFALLPFATSVTYISLSFCGYNAAIYVAGEVTHADRNVPRAMVLGVVAVTLIYVAVNAVFVLAPDPEAIRSKREVATLAAQAVGGSWFAGLVRGVVALALFTSVSALVMSGPRVYAKMAEDGFLPGFFKFRGETPASAIFFQAALAILVVYVSRLEELLGYLSVTLGVSSAMTIGSIFLVRRREGAAALPVPGYPLVPLVFVLATLAFAALLVVDQWQDKKWKQVIPAAATLVIGVGLYFVMKWRRG